MSTPAPQIRSLYRRLLRELPVPPSTIPTRTQHQKLSSPSTLQKRIRDTINPTSEASASGVASSSAASSSVPKSRNTPSQIQQAEQFAQYVQAQRTYLALIERYNPGMGMSEEERVRLSARRIGMELPVEFVREGEGEGGK